MPRPAPHGRPVLSSIKTIASVAAVSDRLAGWHYLRHKFIGAMPQVCHSEERSDVGISQYHVGSWESYRRNRDCLPEIATSAAPPRNDNSGGAGAVLAIARTNRSCSAGSGMPLPYNGWCGRRSATKPTSPVGTGSVLTAAGTSRQCLPEIATAPLGPRNDKSGAITVLAIARANRSCSAGPGCPLPYSTSSAASRHFPLTLLSPNRGSCRRPLPSRGDFFRAARPSYAAGS